MSRFSDYNPWVEDPHKSHSWERCSLVHNHFNCVRCKAVYSEGRCGGQQTFNGLHYYVNGPKFWKPCTPEENPK